MEKTTGDMKSSETLSEDCHIEYIPFKAGTEIVRLQNDGALLQATLHDKHRIYNCEFGAGDTLEFSGEERGALVKATITGKREIQGVLLSAESQPVTLHFHYLNDQLRPGVMSATINGEPLAANNIAFRQDSVLMFHRPGHIGAGDLYGEVLIDNLWFGPKQAQPTTTTSAEQAELKHPSGVSVVISMKLTSQPAWPTVDLNKDIGFYTNGHVAYGTLSRNQIVNGLLLKAGSRVFFYSNSQLCAGTLAEPTTISGIKVTGRFRFRERGTLLSAELACEQVIDGIKCTGQVKLYDDGKLYGSTLVGKQALGEFLCEGHFTLRSDGNPCQFYLAKAYPERGSPYKEGWLIRPNGYSARRPGDWKDESFDLVNPEWDFERHYQPIAAVCKDNTCNCRAYDPIDWFRFRNEIQHYLDKAGLLMGRQRLDEARILQETALAYSLKYRQNYSGELLPTICRDMATRLVLENQLDAALAMLDKAESYRQQFGSDRRYYKSEECLIAFRKCQIYLQQKDFSKLEPLLQSVIKFCENDPSDHGSSSLPQHEQNIAIKMLGDCYAEKEQFELAEKHYNNAISKGRSELSSLDVFRAYHTLLVRMEQHEKAAELANRIEQIGNAPRGWLCGQAYANELQNLHWEPTLNLD
ncbi:MAG: hypothetical protein U0103_23830 [Candidatus Obscuribacterales bacterium]